MDKLKQRMEFTAYGIFTAIFFIACVCCIGAGHRDMEPVQKMAQAVADEAISPFPVTTVEAEERPTAIMTAMLETVAELPAEPEKVYTYYDVPMEDALQEYTQDVCEEYGFDQYDIILAMIDRESDFRDWVVSGTNDYGLMQINICNHEWLAEDLGLTGMLDARQNIWAGVYIISTLYEKYDDIGLALMAYNCGERGAKNLWEQGIYSTAYSREIIAAASQLEVRSDEA